VDSKISTLVDIWSTILIEGFLGGFKRVDVLQSYRDSKIISS
jgi:hypothetical protein